MSISFFPLWQTLKNYRLSFLHKDLLAGLSVALLALPQAMAYAFVANLPTQVGIFSAIFGTIFTSAFGASYLLITGPTTQIAILLQSGISEIISTYYGQLPLVERDAVAMNLLIQITLGTGLMQIAGGLFNLGRLTQFTSRAVIVGYMLGTAVAIILMQAFPFLGITTPRGHYPLFEKFWLLLLNITSLQVGTTLLGIICFILLLSLSRIVKPGLVPIIIFIFAALVVHFSPNPLGNILTVNDLGAIYSDYPKIMIPSFELRMIASIVPLSFAIALLSVLQATAIGRSYTRAKDPPYHDNQEIFGLGMGNTVTAFFGAMPVAGSFARTEINYSMGAKTRLAGVVSGVFLFAILLFLSPLVATIPLTALAAMMMINAYNLVNFKDLFLCLRATASDAFVLIMTFVATLLFPFDTALYIGIAISVVLYLKQAGTPFLVEYAFTNVGKLRPLESEDERPDPRIAIFQAEGELFFGAAELLQNKLRLIGEEESIKILILQLLKTRHIDASSCIALKNVAKYFKDTGRIFLISGVSSEVFKILQEAGLISKIGEKNIYLANEQLPGESTRKAYADAKQRLGAPI